MVPTIIIQLPDQKLEKIIFSLIPLKHWQLTSLTVFPRALLCVFDHPFCNKMFPNTYSEPLLFSWKIWTRSLCPVWIRSYFIRSSRKGISRSVIYKLQQGEDNKFTDLLLYPYLTPNSSAGSEIWHWNRYFVPTVQCCAQSSEVSQPASCCNTVCYNIEGTLSSR